ncbi:hypothetical protein [Streptomyces sp. NPDC005799]|uniref:hypothetical protein n=1 Tax=Streptomyces sp. NPDC005799 TaxID=3154678 RepID=UPI0033D50A61
MPGAAAGGHPVVVLGEHGAVRSHQHRPERLVPGLQRLFRQLDTSAPIRQFGVPHDHDVRLSSCGDLRGQPRRDAAGLESPPGAAA